MSQTTNREAMSVLMLRVFEEEIIKLREEGQKEYARADDNCFANFERVSFLLGIPREKVLLVYAFKHLDGVVSYLDGHTSQREDVRGRINDLIVYLFLLRGMIEENESRGLPETQAFDLGALNLADDIDAAQPSCKGCRTSSGHAELRLVNVSGITVLLCLACRENQEAT